MKLAKALKLKNKLVSEISELYAKAQTNNSKEGDSPRKYSVKQALAEAAEKTEKLIALKVAIQAANAPVMDRIFRLSEVKTRIVRLAGLDVEESSHRTRWSETPVVTTVEVDVLERDAMVLALKQELEAIQEELDHFNFTTEV